MTTTSSSKNFQASDTRKFLFMVRFKPPLNANDGFGLIEGAVKEASGAIDSAKNAVNDAASSIPGLKMFVKEEKKESASEKEYKYDYSNWEAEVKKLDNNLKELFHENKAQVFEFSSKDTEGRKSDGLKLYEKVNSFLSSCKKYKVQLFFVGLGQGGNVVNECLELLASDSNFKSEKWNVQQVVYVATPEYRDCHKLNSAPMKNTGLVLNVYNAYDITHRVIDFFDDREKLLKCMDEVNKSTLTFLVGKVQMEILNLIQGVVRIIREFSAMHIGSDAKEGEGPEDKVAHAKAELERQKSDLVSCIENLVNFKDPILDDLKAMLDTSSLQQMEQVFSGFEKIPEQTAMTFLSDVTGKGAEIADRAGRKASDEVTYHAQKLIDDNINKHTGGGSAARHKEHEAVLQFKDIAALFHCLHVPLSAIVSALKKIGAKTPVSEELTSKLIQRAGISKIMAARSSTGTVIDVSDGDPYNQKLIERYHDSKKIDKVKQFINDLCDQAGELASGKYGLISSAEGKKELAELLVRLIRPMLMSKGTVLKEMMDWFKGIDITRLLDDDQLSKIGLKPLGLFSNDAFRKELHWYEEDIRNIEKEFNRLKGFFDKVNYDLMEDTLYFVYNAHNFVIQVPSSKMLHAIDKATGIYDFKISKGLISSFPDGNEYRSGQAGERNNVKPVESYDTVNQ